MHAKMMRPSDAPLVRALKGRRHRMKRSIRSFTRVATAWAGLTDLRHGLLRRRI